jgi:7,8-dihydroneopterin aldolase/epimerase/oxygenase
MRERAPVSSEHATVERLTLPDGAPAGERLYRMFVKDLVLQVKIGAYPHERLRPQPVRINVDLQVREASGPLNDDLVNVLSYDRIIAAIKDHIAKGHINLVETLAEDIATICLADARVVHARIGVEKLAVEPNAAGVGIEIERRRQQHQHHPAIAELFPQAFDGALRGGRGRRDGGN